MCFDSGGSESRTIVQSNDLPEYVRKGGEENYEKAKELSDRPYEAYTGPRLAGFTGEQSSGFDMIKDAMGTWQPNLDTASKMTTDVGAKSFQDIDLSGYMNPYTSTVLQQNLDEMNRQGQISRNGIKSSAATIGQLDTDRHGVVEAEQMRNEGLLRNQMIAKTNADAFNNAYSAYRDDEARNLEAAKQTAALGQLGTSLGYADADAMMSVGNLKQAMEQGNLDISYEDFLRQRDNPIEMLNLRMNALLNTPYNTQSKQVSPYETSNQLAQNVGAFGALAGGVGQLSEAGGFAKLFGL